MATRELTIQRRNGEVFDLLYPVTGWAQVKDKPATFAPTAHNHSADNINSGTLGVDRIPTITNAKLQGMATATIKGRVTASTGAPEDLTVVQVQNMLLMKSEIIAPATANYQLVLTNANKMLLINHASDRNIQIPTNATVAFPIDTEIVIMKYGAGNVTVTALAGVTLRPSSPQTISTQYKTFAIKKIGANEWVLAGN